MKITLSGPFKWLRREKPIKLKDNWLERVTRDMMERRAKFDITEDYYLRYRCTKCGLFADANTEEEGFGSCECGNTDIWVTRGGGWIKKHGTQAFWDNITTTDDIMVPLVKRKWLVGQEKPMMRERMQLARWVHKLKAKQAALKRGDLESAFMKENPGPYELRVSEPGCGKSLASKIIGEEAESLYKENDIELTDVLTIENPADKQRPLVRQVPCHAVQGGGCLAPRISRQAERGAYSVQKEKQQLLLTMLMVAVGLGAAMLGTGLFLLGLVTMEAGIVAAWLQYMSVYLFFFTTGVLLMVFPLFIMVMSGSNLFTTNRADNANVPHPIVQHGDKPKYVQDATVSNSSTLLGSIEWNAYGNCLLPGTIVYHNPRPEVASEEQTHVYDRNGQSQDVTKFERQLWEGTAYRVKGKYLAPIETTSEHPFYVLQRVSKWDNHEATLRRSMRVWKTARQLDGTSDYLIVPKIKIKDGEHPVLTMPIMRGGSPNPSPVPDRIILDEEVGYFLGWYVAEGWAAKKTDTIGLTMHKKERPIAEELVRIVSSKFHLKARIRNRLTTDAMDTMFKSQRLAPFLRELVGDSSHNKRIPNEVFSAPLSVRLAFLRGYLMGDGGITQTGSLVVKTASKMLHYDTHALLLSCGMLGSAGHRDGDAYMLSLSPRFVALLYGKDYKVQTHGQTTEQFLEDNDAFYVPIETIEPFDYAGLICNVVTEDHTFMAPMVTHNTPGLTGPLHRRVVSGIVHRQSDLIIDIDEVRNLKHYAAVELLDVMENNQSFIRSRGGGGAGNEESSAILAISTNDPVPADFMLICNGNMDQITNPSSVFFQVPAFYDRFGYGDRIYFETHLDATPENEIKIAQVITDEVYRFRMFPMEKDGILQILEHMRAHAENNMKFKIMFRFVINLALQAFNLALLRKDTLTRASDVKRAIEEFTDTLQSQAMKEQLENRAPFGIIRTSGEEYGMVNGLAVLPVQGVDSRSAGKVFPVVAQVFVVDDPKYGEFIVTGEMKEESSWVQDSKKTVRTVIRKLYGKDIAKDYYTHISFAQQKDVEGPSAGAAMTLALMSLLGDPRLPEKDRKPIPLRLDTAITGTIELIPDPHNPLNVRVGAIGGVPDKVQGAASAGCNYVVIPQENFEHTLTKQKYPCRIFGADSILAYFDLLRADGNGIMPELGKPETDEDIEQWAARRAERKGKKVEGAT